VKDRRLRLPLYAALLLLFLLRHDLWLWDDPRLVLGLPVGLTYHLGYSLVTALVMLVLVTLAWPETPDDDETLPR
jgi:hypothetical protein